MALTVSFRKAYWFFAACGALYFVFISLLTNTWIQRHVLYLHKIHTSWWEDPNTPEQFGFLKNQVQPFNISTPDGEILYAWHILPITKYVASEKILVSSADDQAAYDIKNAFDLLSKNPSSRLVIYFHGNAGTVSQGWRPDTYRALSAAAGGVHVLAVDYRGFGHSTGTPDEQGLILDGISTVQWAMDTAKIPSDRIALVGASLGTAVATAVAEHFVVKSQIEFAGTVLVAPFSDIPTLLQTYSFGGIIPVLSPLKPYPKLQKLFLRYVRDTWNTTSRLADLIRRSQRINVYLIHSKNDFEIFWKHTEALFYASANATSPSGLSRKQIDGVKLHQDLQEGGLVESWNADGTKRITKQIVRYGGHNRLATYSCVVRAVHRIFELENEENEWKMQPSLHAEGYLD